MTNTATVPTLRRAFRQVVESVARPVRSLVLRCVIPLWPSVRAEGFEVINLAEPTADRLYLAGRIAEAVRVIDRRDRRRSTRLRRDVRRFVLVGVAGPEYIHPIHACMLSDRQVASASAEELALVIVHEGTHARLSSMGIRYDYHLRGRIERFCVEEEIDFARKLPNSAVLIEQAAAKLAKPWWTKEEEFNRRVRQLEELGRPSWYLRLYRFLWDPR